jgi:hypothetical protein
LREWRSPGVRANTGLPAELKWPNDLVRHAASWRHFRRDLRRRRTDRRSVGIGISAPHAVSIGPAARPSIETELGRPVDRALVPSIAAALAARYESADRSLRCYSDRLAQARSLPAPPSMGQPHGVVRACRRCPPDGALLMR